MNKSNFGVERTQRVSPFASPSEHIRDIRDPEHPYTLEVLGVVRKEDIAVDDAGSTVSVQFTPTIPHCSMATLIGLTIKVKLLRSLPRRFKVIGWLSLTNWVRLRPHFLGVEDLACFPKRGSHLSVLICNHSALIL